MKTLTLTLAGALALIASEGRCAVRGFVSPLTSP